MKGETMNNVRKNKVFRMTAGGLLLAIGIIIPRVFHIFGTPNLGKMLLPMHLPIFVSGIYLGPFYGLLTGFIAPLINSLFGMPVFPQNIIMAFELAAYGFFAGFLMNILVNFKLSRPIKVYCSLISSMIAGRLVNALVLLILAKLFGMNVPAPISVVSSALLGLPGILIQLFLVPAIVYVLSVIEVKYNR